MPPSDSTDTNIAYYDENKDILDPILDGLILAVTPASEETEGEIFAALVRVLARQPDKAVIVAAFAAMRLARQATPTERTHDA